MEHLLAAAQPALGDEPVAGVEANRVLILPARRGTYGSDDEAHEFRRSLRASTVSRSALERFMLRWETARATAGRRAHALFVCTASVG
jgi:hypothetical protein